MHRHKDRGAAAQITLYLTLSHTHAHSHTEAICIGAQNVTHSAPERESRVVRARAHEVV
jgi:hypothetical protein